MKKFFTFLAAMTAMIIISPVRGEDYTIEPKADGAAAVKSRAIPLRYDNSATWGSVSQQIYLASELVAEGAGIGDIDAITFYYGATSSAVSAQSRPIQIYLMQVPSEGASKVDSFAIRAADAKSTFLYVSSTNKTAGIKVYDGALATEAVSTSETKKVKINFDNSFPWDGSSNIVLTVFDMSSKENTVSATGYSNLRFMISKTNHPRFLSKKWMSTDTDDRSSWITDISNNLTGRAGEYWTASASATIPVQSANRSYVNKVDFTITALATPSTPTGLAVSSKSTTSASLTWNDASSADSYALQSSSNGLDWSNLASGITGTAYNWTGLTANTTYYVRVSASNSAGNSEWSDAISFTTEAVHSHNDISFEKWNATDELPTSGNYYLSNNVTFDLFDGNVTLTGDLKLCLNGKTANLNGARIIVPDNKTLTIYDNEGGGKITSFFPSSDGAMVSSGLITVENGGTLIISEGVIDNTYIPDADGTSIAICGQVGSVVRLSGAPSISSNAIDFFLGNSTAITIAGALSNAAPYKVYKVLTGDFTSGWSTYMSSANPTEYFTSANASFGVCLNGSEARMVKALSFDGANNNNTAITDNNGQLVNVKLANRAFTSASYNTICLPFALTDAQLQDIFGSSYDLEAFVSSSLEGEELELAFTKVYSLTAGKPYLIKPSADAVNPSFTGVTISATSPAAETEDAYIWFYGVYAPTELEANNKNLLFLGANNTLYWPSVTGNIKGFRAYFNVRGAAQQCASRARIVQASDAATSTEAAKAHEAKSSKFIQDGQIYIEHNGVRYNTMGQKVQ